MASNPTPSPDFNKDWPNNYVWVETGISSTPTDSVNEVQNLTLSGSSGTFTLTLDASSVGLGSLTTGAITYSANTTTLRSNIQTALDSKFGTNAFVMTGNNAPYSITAASTFKWGGIDLPLFSADVTSLSSGASTIAQATAGVVGTLGRRAPKAALLIDVDNTKIYLNTGTIFKQTWTEK